MADKKIVSGKLLGIDIGVSSIKVAEVVSDNDGVFVTALGETPMPEDLLVNEEIVNSRQLASIIKKLVKDCGITSKRCVVSITAPNNTLARTIEVPKSDNKKQVRLSVKYEVERLFPHSNYDTEFDFFIKFCVFLIFFFKICRGVFKRREITVKAFDFGNFFA